MFGDEGVEAIDRSCGSERSGGFEKDGRCEMLTICNGLDHLIFRMQGSLQSRVDKGCRSGAIARSGFQDIRQCPKPCRMNVYSEDRGMWGVDGSDASGKSSSRAGAKCRHGWIRAAVPRLGIAR